MYLESPKLFGLIKTCCVVRNISKTKVMDMDFVNLVMKIGK